MEAMDSTKLLLYPQILLACFAILPTSYIHIFSLILELLCKVRMPSNDARRNRMHDNAVSCVHI